MEDYIDERGWEKSPYVRIVARDAKGELARAFPGIARKAIREEREKEENEEGEHNENQGKENETMENKAEMSLSEYEAVVRENERLRNLLRECKARVEADAFRCVREYEIEDMKREDLIKEIDEDDDLLDDERLVAKHSYMLCVDEIVNSWPCFTRDEIMGILANRIRRCMTARLNSLPAED